MDVKVDSRKIKKGDTFVALKTINNDGHKYIEDAIKNGAEKVVAEKGLYSVETLIVNNTREYLINYLKDNYYNKIKDLKLIGMTGTNGKTTTCFLLHKLLNKSNIKCAYIGTLGFYIDDKINELDNTTPDILDIYEMLIHSQQFECEFVIMEVSSHALAMGRVETLEFDYVIFSNLTKDHLDYHQSMEDYALAKQKLFYKLKPTGKAIVNCDDPSKNYYLLSQNNNITYGFNESDYQIIEYNIKTRPSYFIIENQNKQTIYETILLGKHNIYNLLVIIIVLTEIGIAKEQIPELIKEVEPPIGRMDMVNYKENQIIIDYAHTPDAVENVLNTVKELAVNNIYTIIGCGGNRDKTKRPEMAKVATDLSTKVIFTSDNPRMEDPKDIINDMLHGLDNFNYQIEANREEAIKKGIQMLENSDILLILGKGHETYQVIGNEKIDFDDKQKVIDIIRR